MARPLAPRCVATYGHLDALAIVFLSRPCTTVRQIARQHSKGNSAQPCVHLLSSREGHWETMNKECPRLHLKSLRCARCSVPLFHPGAESDANCIPREATPGCGSMSAQLVSYRLELKQPSPQARHHTECSAVSRVPCMWVDQFALQHGKGNSAV